MKYIKTFNESIMSYKSHRLGHHIDIHLLEQMFKPLGVQFKCVYSDATLPYYSIKISLPVLTILRQLVSDIMMAKYGVEIENANFLMKTTSENRLMMAHDIRILMNSLKTDKQFTMGQILTIFLEDIRNLSNLISIKYKKNTDKVIVQNKDEQEDGTIVSNPERMDLPVIKDILISFTEFVLNNSESSNVFWGKLGEIVSEKILKEISGLPDGFKILNTMKKNNPELWKILGQNDVVKMGSEMGDLGF